MELRTKWSAQRGLADNRISASLGPGGVEVAEVHSRCDIQKHAGRHKALDFNGLQSASLCDGLPGEAEFGPDHLPHDGIVASRKALQLNEQEGSVAQYLVVSTSHSRDGLESLQIACRFEELLPHSAEAAGDDEEEEFEFR